MIRYLWQYKLSPTAFLDAVPAFAKGYLRTRPWRLFLWGLPAILLAGCCCAAYLLSDQARRSGTLETRYRNRLSEAVAAGDPDAAETHLARLLTLSDNPREESLTFVRLMFAANNGASRRDLLVPPVVPPHQTAVDEESRTLIRAIAVAQNLAPRLARTPGYQPAHEFLAEFWQTRQPATDTTRVMALQHRVHAEPDNFRVALELGRTVHDLGFPQQALNALQRHQTAHPDVLLQMAMSWDALNQADRASEAINEAARLYAEQLQQDPENGRLREKLSRVMLAGGRPLEGILIFAEGLTDGVTAEASDRLIQRYSWWLTSLPESSVPEQMAQLRLALRWGTLPAADLSRDSATLTTAAGESVTLPGPVVALHSALRNGEGDWLIPLLLGTSAAASDLPRGVQLLRQAQEIVPEHPVVANNLAWTLHQQYLQNRGEIAATGNEATEQHAILAEAAQLASAAVAADSTEAQFRATRGVIAVTRKDWTVAKNDLEYAVSAGVSTVAVTKALVRVREQPSSSPQ